MESIWIDITWDATQGKDAATTFDLATAWEQVSSGYLIVALLVGDPLSRPSERGWFMLAEYLPPYYLDSRIMNYIAYTEGLELDDLRATFNDILNQFFVATATWGLDRWEQELNLPAVLDYTYDERRQRILGKLRGLGTTTLYALKQLALIWNYGTISVVEDHENYSVIIRFIDTRGIPAKLVDFQRAIRDILQGHLGVQYVFTYFIWDELDAKLWTWDALDALALTWDQLEVYK